MIQFAIQSFSMTFGRVTFGLTTVVFRWCGPQTENEKWFRLEHMHTYLKKV